MFILISYDIGETQEKEGARRLREVARACLNYGQRVQYSVFEVHVNKTQWTRLRQELLDLIDPKLDNLRFYFLDDHTKHEHHGIGRKLNLSGTLLF